MGVSVIGTIGENILPESKKEKLAWATLWR
jgi:hypothetical protein